MNPLLYSCSQTLINMTILQNSLCLVSVSLSLPNGSIEILFFVGTIASSLTRMFFCFPSSRNKTRGRKKPLPLLINQILINTSAIYNFLLVQMYVCCASTTSFRDAVSRHLSSLSPAPFSLANRMLETGIREVCKYEIQSGYVSLGIWYKYVCMRYFHIQHPILAQKLQDSQIFKFC